eukprot:4246118-Pyramimonas_sp.AAC.1
MAEGDVVICQFSRGKYPVPNMTVADLERYQEASAERRQRKRGSNYWVGLTTENKRVRVCKQKDDRVNMSETNLIDLGSAMAVPWGRP